MKVVVVGAGLSGQAAALGLSSLGFKVDLLEKHSSFDVRGSTLGLAPNGSKALQEICPDEDVCTLTDLGLCISGFDGVSVLGWWIIRDWLLERVQKQDPNITLHMGVKLISIDDTSDDTKAIVHCQDCDFEGDLVIGADGVHSQVRSLLNLHPNPSAGYRGWRGSASADGEPVLEAILDKGIRPVSALWGTTTVSIFNHHPKLYKRLNWVVTAVDDPTIEPGVTTPFDLAKPYWSEEDELVFSKLWERSDELELTKSFEMATAVLPSKVGRGWGGRGRVTLIGDSALRPTTGFGTALAFEDCAVLRRKLKGFETENKSRQDCEELILDFENERLERVKVISDQQQEAAEAAHHGKKSQTWNEEYKAWVYAGV